MGWQHDAFGGQGNIVVPTAQSPDYAAGSAGWQIRKDGSVLDVPKDRFVIGRGAHCDLAIESPKVSREHAALVREADGWWIEDLGSSNGTWFKGERISRRKVEHGDEYFVSAERLRCTLR